MSVWSLTIAIERLWRFQKAKKESLQVALGVTPLLKQHKLERGDHASRRTRGSGTAISRACWRRG